MLVVSDNMTANKFRSVPGTIVYREDKEKLYVAKHKKLSALAEEEKVRVSKHYTVYTSNAARIAKPNNKSDSEVSDDLIRGPATLIFLFANLCTAIALFYYD